MALYDAIFVKLAERLFRESEEGAVAEPGASEVELLRAGLTHALLDLDVFEALLAVLPETPARTGVLREPLPIALKDEMLTHGLSNLTSRQLVQLATRADWLAAMKCELETNAPLHWTTLMEAVFPGNADGVDRRDQGFVSVTPSSGPTQGEAPLQSRPEASPTTPLEAGSNRPALAVPASAPTAAPSKAARRWGASVVGGSLVFILLLALGVLFFSSRPQATAAATPREIEEGKKDGEAASKMKLEASQLKLEILRRLQTAERLVRTKPNAGDNDKVVTRATLFYNIQCIHGTDVDAKGEYGHLFITFTEYTTLPTSQLAVKLVMSSDYPKPTGSAELERWNKNRTTAIAILEELDELSAKHSNFSQASEAKAFEADILEKYPKLISKLKSLDYAGN